MIPTIAIRTAGVIALNAVSLDLVILDSTATVIRARATEMNLVGIVTASTMIRTV
jgi:hypothetical protein